jgi:hypothetical protein
MLNKITPLLFFSILFIICTTACISKRECTLKRQRLKNKNNSLEYKNKKYKKEMIQAFGISRAYGEFGVNSYNYIIKIKPELKIFANKLNSSLAKDKEDIISYLFTQYPILIPTNEGKMIHHHPFKLRDKSKRKWLIKKIISIKGDKSKGYNKFDMYRFVFTDFAFAELGEYDNVRYSWWNPYVENYGDPRAFSGNSLIARDSLLQKHYERSLILYYFKLTFDRSSDNLKKIANLYKKPFFKIVTPRLYKKLKLDITVNCLIHGYRYFLKKNLKGFLALINKKYFNNYYLFDCRWQMKGKNRSKYLYHCVRSSHAKYNLKWYYTFWERRHAEHNHETVYQILKEIQKHYISL